MKNLSKTKARKFKKEFKIIKVTYQDICDILNKQGYEIVFFNSIYNVPDVDNLITALNLNKLIKELKGFTYADNNHRIIFLNEDLSEQEKLLVLLHEEGHIYCDHLNEKTVIGRDVIQEYEANEFVHYMLNESLWQKIKTAIFCHKKAFSIIAILLSLVIVVGVAVGLIVKENSYYGEYYITQSGNKYHEKECIFVKDKNTTSRLTKKQFENGEYEPCGICLPNDN